MTPRLQSIVLDAPDVRGLAEFYRAVLGLQYRPGDEPPAPGEPDPKGSDWLVLDNPGGVGLAFQQVDDLPPATWPGGAHPQQLHLDTSVDTAQELQAERERVLGLGARQLLDRFDDADEPLYVFADPAGHPFCIFVA